MTKVKEMKDAGTLTAAELGGKDHNNTAGTVASQMYGGWYEGTFAPTRPILKTANGASI
jgi:lactose/L-arabinose transport system substrate-binding protein